ncbi:MAG TPA: efflux RND transporter periplasmic adaptor subunit [Candidatus Omnitrophota bacterium]|nr:efflux RND transporter periplasmic adaptor subunit [Candidatus Omnitrophota bacterium]
MTKLNRLLPFIVLIVLTTGIFWVSYHFEKHYVVMKKNQAGKVVYYCPMHPNYTSDHPGTCPICGMTLVKRELEKPASSKSMNMLEMPMGEKGQIAPSNVFTIQQLVAMKPHEICLLHKCKHGMCTIAMTPQFAKLGKCPMCGEALGVIVKEAMPQGYTSVALGPEKQQVIGVKTAPVEKRVLAKTIRNFARIAYDPELYQAEEEYVQAIQALKKAAASDPEIKEQAAKLVDSSKIKLRLLGLNDPLMQEVETAGKADRSLLYAEPNGKVWLYAPIYEYELPFVHVGDKMEVEVPSMAGKSFQGVIRSIDAVVDPVTRSVRVRAQLENPDNVLKPEMYVNATLHAPLGEKIAVPEDAVFMTGSKNLVFVAKPDNVFEPREVELGAKADGFDEVKSGVQAGEVVVTSGNFLIDSESRLKAALENMSGEGGMQGMHHG